MDLYIVGPSRPSAETNRIRFGVGLGLILTPNMATSRSTSGRLSRGSLPVARLLIAHLNMGIELARTAAHLAV